MHTPKILCRLAFFLALLTPHFGWGQFSPDYSRNYFEERNHWITHFDSVKTDHFKRGDSLLHGTGYNGFHRWSYFWDQYMPASGSYEEAVDILRQALAQQQSNHLEALNNGGGSASKASSVGVGGLVDWEEIGPDDPSDLEIRSTNGTWYNPHINNNGSVAFNAHMAQAGYLLVHPENPDVIYACAHGATDLGAGGLFRSTDAGFTWTNMNTDQIPICDIQSVVVKPMGELPSASKEFIFIGLKTGAVYRTDDDGQTWIEAGYYGTNPYPYLTGSSNPSLSLPYSFDYINFTWDKYDKNFKMELASIGGSTSKYQRIMVARYGGLYYSDNYFANIFPSSNSITNQIAWHSYDLDPILNAISLHDPNSTSRDYAINDIEYVRRNGTDYYIALLQIRERDDNNGVVTGHWQYLIQSTDYGTTWQFTGGQSSPNSANGVETGTHSYRGFSHGNIEVKDEDPNYIYVASAPKNNPTNSYRLHRYEFDTDSWTDLSEPSGFSSGIGAQPNGFCIDPQNDENWYYYTNATRRFINGTMYSGYSYGHNFHADARDVEILPNGVILMGHDGGIGRSTDGGVNFDLTSMGMNSAASDHVAVGQYPPFYVTSGFWHAGLQVLNPETGKWHYRGTYDGGAGKTLFLNNEVFSSSTQFGSYRVHRDYDLLGSVAAGGPMSGSENMYGRAYMSRYSGNQDVLYYSNNDLTNSTPVPGITAYNKYSTTPHVVPNNPDLLCVLIDDFFTPTGSAGGGAQTLNYYRGMDATTPAATLIRSIDLHAVYDPTMVDSADYRDIVFDPRGNGNFYMILKGGALWNPSSQNRIVAYDFASDAFTDITYVTDDVINGQGNSFPHFIQIHSIDLDRQTDRVYIGTTYGVYFLDRDNQIWRKHSKNLPFAKACIDVLHCSGEIYASVNGRGIWKSEMYRDDLPEASTWEISTSQTWDGRVNLFNTLVIKTGTKLTLTGEIFVFGDQKIVVEPGAELDVDGGTITTWCGDYWHGIQVAGNHNLVQSTTNQGRVITRNGATIEFAREAIQTWERDNWASTGGIVNVSNTTFRNNKTSVFFYPYHFIASGGSEVLNIGKISNCEFLWDDDFIGERPYAAVVVFDVAGVKIEGSDFNDLRTNLSPSDERATGIFSLDAFFKATARQTAIPLALHHEFGTGGGYDVNQFVNLDKGIHAMGATSIYSVTIDHCLFTNNEEPLILEEVNNAIVTRNKVDFKTTHPPEIQTCKGFQLISSTGFKVEGNTFESDVDYAYRGGIHALNTGAEDNVIYRNYFNDQHTSLSAEGTNSNASAASSQSGNFEGLYWKCNEMNRSDYDMVTFTLPGVDGQGVKQAQGSPDHPAHNIFTDVADGPLLHIKHQYDYEMYYYYNDDFEIRERPQYVDPDVQVIYATYDDDDCPSNIYSGKPGDPVFRKTAALQSQVDELDQEISAQTSTLQQHLANGQRAELFQLVSELPANSTQTLARLRAESPYLSAELLRQLGASVPEHLSYREYRDLIAANTEAMRAPQLMDYLRALPWDEAYLKSLQEKSNEVISDRQRLEARISDLKSRRTQLHNQLIAASLEGEEIDWNEVESRLRQRGDAYLLAQLADQKLGMGDLTGCAEALLQLEKELGNLPLELQRTEMSDFIRFKRYILSIADGDGVVRKLTAEQAKQLREYAETMNGKAAVQAQNLLCFHLGECPETQLQVATSTVQATEEQPVKGISEGDFMELLAVPNPNRGEFEVQVSPGCEIESLSVWDLQGKKVDFAQTPVSDHAARVKITAPQAGVVLLQARCTDGSVFRTRVVLQ